MFSCFTPIFYKVKLTIAIILGIRLILKRGWNITTKGYLHTHQKRFHGNLFILKFFN